MDPLSIASSVVGLTATCLSTCKKLHDLAGEYQDVPAVIAMICSESTIISIGLSELQMKILRRDDLAQAWASKTEIWTAFETALTGCMVVFSCLEAETRSLRSKNPGVWAKIKFIWNQDRLKELLGALRGQQSSITFLLNLLELETLSNIQKDIRQNTARIKAAASEAQSLRSCNPSVKMDSESIFDNDAANLSFFHLEAFSGNAPSELDFEFDHLVINSQAYRRVFIKAQAEMKQLEIEDVDSDTGTVREVDTSPAQSQKKSASLVRVSREKPISFAKDLVRPSFRTEKVGSWSDVQIFRPYALVSTSTCYGCHKTITGHEVRVLGETWHVGCFTCSDCGVSLQNGYRLSKEENGIQSEPLCEEDYIRRRDIQCHKCQETILGDFVAVLDRRYHAHHFTCDRCEIVFTEDSDYHLIDSRIYCMLHFCREAAYYCHACKFPIMGNYREKDGQESKWHTFCLELSSWRLELPVSSNGRRYLDSIHDQSLRRLTRFYQELHDTRANEIYLCGSRYIKDFRDSLTISLRMRGVAPSAESYEHFKGILARLFCLFKAAAKGTTDRSGEAEVRVFMSGFQKHFNRYTEGLQASPQFIAHCISELIKPLLGVSFAVCLQNNDDSWDVKQYQLDELIKTLGASSSCELADRYNHEPTGASEQNWKCAVCFEDVTGNVLSEWSYPYRKLHPLCRSLACHHETSDGGEMGDISTCIHCRWKTGDFDFVHYHEIALYEIWQSWRVSANLGA
ncbi:hypothetical protein BFJ63_vAg11582 [Fusarium oxysporum f. sp. narcissi]|uniref:LIM zinc-binding domain-containing protein n=1 Tax=Fusarium oxysporum f. sp. narcissi TaxID=451672 RepID=A0A4Q2VEC4_FUSOX|nr:hypothetical protein BFJ63_vAg11582 [Fusarium oxysporum f. sp. narcissi]